MVWLTSLVLFVAVLLVLTGLALMLHGSFRLFRMSRAGDRSDQR
jgi:hypothetical protein